MWRKGVNFYELKSSGIHEKYAEATWNHGNHPSVCLSMKTMQIGVKVADLRIFRMSTDEQVAVRRNED